MFAAALIYILAVMSPGPNFILVSRFAASNSIRAGIGASLGIVLSFDGISPLLISVGRCVVFF